jgi:hypothetical protein
MFYLDYHVFRLSFKISSNFDKSTQAYSQNSLSFYNKNMFWWLAVYLAVYPSPLWWFTRVIWLITWETANENEFSRLFTRYPHRDPWVQATIILTLPSLTVLDHPSSSLTVPRRPWPFITVPHVHHFFCHHLKPVF